MKLRVEEYVTDFCTKKRNGSPEIETNRNVSGSLGACFRGTNKIGNWKWCFGAV